MRRSWLRLFWLIVVIAGAVAGYLVSSGLGTRLLHREIETQLSRLLEGPVEIAEVDIRWEDGLCVEARDVSAYPIPIANSPPALQSRRILAWVDLISLLIGRLELSTLVLEGPQLRLVQNPDGSFVGLPLPPRSSPPETGSDDRSSPERAFALLASLDDVASVFADRFRAADTIEVLDGTISWTEGGHAESDDALPALRFELLNGRAERNWLSEAIAIELAGVFVDGQHAPFPIEIGVDREEGQNFVWSLDLFQIPLDVAERTLTLVERTEFLGGTLDVHLRLETERQGDYQLSIDAEIADAEIQLRRSGSIFNYDRVDAETELLIRRNRIQVRKAGISGGGFGIEFKGTIERPVRLSSPTRIEARVLGLHLEDVASYARSLESESETLFTVARLTDRVQSGDVDYIEAAGTASLDLWYSLATARTREIPSGFVLSVKFHDVIAESAPGELFEELEGEVEWVDDQIVLRNGNAVYRGDRLPQIDAVVNGVSHLVRTSDASKLVSQAPPPMPGLSALFEIIKPKNPNALPPVKAIGLEIGRLDHPIFRWPLRDLRVLVEPLRRGLEINIRDGYWGGSAITGEVVWFTDPTSPSVSATLNVGPAPASEPSAVLSANTARWGSGRFEMEFRPRPRLPFQKATGFFRLQGTNLLGDELKFQLSNQGTLAARTTIGLEREGSIGCDLSFALTDGRMTEVGPFVALPPGLATGAIGATGSLAGRVRPDTSFVAELDGRFRAEASDGQVTTDLPLMFRLAEATEGYNPFADDNEVEYETMTGSFELKHGVISVPNFEIEGPLRVFAKADVDTNASPATIRAVVGIFLFRKPSKLLDNLPLIRSFLPGSERGLIGTYFEVDGPLGEPDVAALPLQSLMTGVPSAIKAPFKALRFLFDRTVGDS